MPAEEPPSEPEDLRRLRPAANEEKPNPAPPADVIATDADASDETAKSGEDVDDDDDEEEEKEGDTVERKARKGERRAARLAAAELEATRRRTLKERWMAAWGPYSQLLPFLKPYRVRFIGGLVLGALTGAISGLLAFVVNYVMQHVFPSGTSKSDMAHLAAHNAGPTLQAVIFACLAIPGVMLLRSTCAYFSGYWMAWVSLKLLVDIRTKLFDHLVRQGIDFFNRNRAGALISRVANDTRVAQTALTTLSGDIVVQPCTIVFAISSLAVFDWKLTMISMIMFPLCLVPIIHYGKRVRKSGGDEEARAGAFMVIMHEAFGGIRLIKSLAREDHESDRFKQAGKDQFVVSLRVRKSMEIVSPMIEAVAALGVGTVLLYVYFTSMPASKFFGMLTGLFILYEPVKRLSRVHVQIQKCLAATSRIFELINEPPTIVDTPASLDIGRSTGHLQFEEVSFSYKKGTPAVRKLTLEIPPGKTCALVGPSGAGKSTLFSLLLRFYDPDSGRILLDGHDITTLQQQSLRNNIGIVAQETFLFHETIYNNILYGRFDATKEEVYAAAKAAFAHKFILEQPFGYDTVVGDKGSLLSGGQQQRLAIARALLRNAPILMLDEATSALDSESEKEIQQALQNLSSGRTVIAIAHRLSTIMRADKIVVLDKGKIRDIGTHEELIEKSAHYRRLYNLQIGIHEPIRTPEEIAARKAGRAERRAQRQQTRANAPGEDSLLGSAPAFSEAITGI